MERSKHKVLRISLSKLAKWRLKIIVLYRHVVVVGGYGALVFVQIGKTLWIGAAVIHIVAQEVGTAAQLDQRHRIGILRVDIGTTVIGRGHTATQFASEVGVLLR